MRYSAITCHALSDSLTGLWSSRYITADLSTAMQAFPRFKFDSEFDAELYRDTWWRSTFEEGQPAAEKVLRRFNPWYPQASVMEQVFLGVAALTDNSETLDNIVSDAYLGMKESFSLEYQDADDAVFKVDDYHAMRLEDNLNAAIFTTTTEWWCRRFEEQARRITAMPCVDWQTFQLWAARHKADTKELAARFLAGPYRPSKPKKQVRRVFNRSLNLFIRMFGEKTAKDFIKGKNLWIHGKHFLWKLKAEPGSVIRFTVRPPDFCAAFRITVCDHYANELAQACVFFQDTPVLDQAVAFGLSITTPDDEMDLLRKTNLYSFTPQGAQNQLLTSMPNVRLTPGFINRPLPAEEDEEDETWVDDELSDPSLDDGPSLDPGNETFYTDWRNRRLKGLITESLSVDPNDPFERAFSSEINRTNDLIMRDATEEQREQMAFFQKCFDIENRIERRSHAQHPIISRLWNKLVPRLDVDPGILEYMRFPEFRFFYLNDINPAPRIEGYVRLKRPLVER